MPADALLDASHDAIRDLIYAARVYATYPSWGNKDALRKAIRAEEDATQRWVESKIEPFLPPGASAGPPGIILQYCAKCGRPFPCVMPSGETRIGLAFP